MTAPGPDPFPVVTRAAWQAGAVTAGTDTIIVVEDDHNISDLVAMYLRREGFRILQADDAEHGLDYIGREHPALLIVELGADDYVTKPFSPRELVARVKAVLRRTGAVTKAEPVTSEIGSVVVDTGRREVLCAGMVVPLTTREFDLLAYLAANRGLALSRRQLLDGVWGEDWYGDERTVDVHVRQLRKKLGDELPLTTVWGVGYRLG